MCIYTYMYTSLERKDGGGQHELAAEDAAGAALPAPHRLLLAPPASSWRTIPKLTGWRCGTNLSTLERKEGGSTSSPRRTQPAHPCLLPTVCRACFANSCHPTTTRRLSP